MEEILIKETTVNTTYVSDVLIEHGMPVDGSEQSSVGSDSVPPSPPGVCSQTDKGIFN